MSTRCIDFIVFLYYINHYIFKYNVAGFFFGLVGKYASGQVGQVSGKRTSSSMVVFSESNPQPQLLSME